MSPYPAYFAGPDPYQSLDTFTMDVKGSAGLDASTRTALI
jgi:hypothetical protein